MNGGLRYQGDASIQQGDAICTGICFVDWSEDGAEWRGRLSDDAPAFNLREGEGAWLRLEDGRECTIVIDRNVAGSGLVEFSNPRGNSDLR
jgi:hypothetical protein